MLYHNGRYAIHLFIAATIIVGSLFSYTTTKAESSDSAAATVTVITPLGPRIRILAVPEKRIANVAGRVFNRGTQLWVKIYHANATRTAENVLYETTVTSNDDGYSENYFSLDALSEGTYDITVKGYSHLTKLYEDATVIDMSNIDITNGTASPLLAGDINLTTGDDEVNALDIAILVDNWSQNHIRSDLNQDTAVNSLDASILLANFNAQGD